MNRISGGGHGQRGFGHKHGGSILSVDYFAYASALRKWNASFKVIFAIISLLLCIILDNIYVSAVVILVMGYLTVVIGGLSFHHYISMMLIPIVFLIFGSIAIAAGFSLEPVGQYQFRVFTTPVGPYFKGGVKPITICVSDFDRAAPHGTGHIKAGLNYAMSLHAIVTAHANGFDENMYLDSATRTKVEETGGANFLFVTKDNKIVTPHSTTILPSITRRSLMYVAEHYLGLEVEERDVYFDEVKDFAECGLCGTAAVISPVGKVVNHGEEICFPSGMEKMGPVTQKLYDTLTGIQMGRIEAPEGWLKVIE